jgi:hypothetical protein
MQPSLSFARITADEWRVQVIQTAAAFNANVVPRLTPPKRSVGRPKRQLDAHTVLVAAAAAASFNPPEEQPAKKQKTRGQYTDWFSSPFIHDIIRAYERSGHRPALTVAALKASAPDDRFDRLTHTTISRWYDKQHVLKPQYKAHLESGLENVRQNGAARAFEEFPAVEEEIKQTLIQLRASGTSINSHIIRWVMQGIIGVRAPDSRLSLLALGKPFVCAWARSQLKWAWRRSTTAASKLPLDWEEQGVQMAMRIAAKMEMKKVKLSTIWRTSILATSSMTHDTFLCFFVGSSVADHQYGPDRCTPRSSKQLDVSYCWRHKCRCRRC